MRLMTRFILTSRSCQRTRPGRSTACIKVVLAKSFLVSAAVASIGLIGEPSWAHHSFSMFDKTKEVVLEGTVTAMEWTNPHVWIRLDVPDEQGEVVKWNIESASPMDLSRRGGWSKTSFQAGDKAAITIHPAKNGARFGDFVCAMLADGSSLGVRSLSGCAD